MIDLKKNKISYGQNVYNHKEISAVLNTLKNGTQMGRAVEIFERKLSKFFSKNID